MQCKRFFLLALGLASMATLPPIDAVARSNGSAAQETVAHPVLPTARDNVGTWTASNSAGGTANANATATVTGVPPRCPAGSSEVTLLNEAFEGSFPPPGWTVNNNTTGCGASSPDWTNSDPGANGNLTGGSGLFASADSDACGSGTAMNARMSTPVLDMTGLTDPEISFAHDYNDLAGADSGALDVSTDGGTTWNNEFTWTVDDRGPRTYTSDIVGAGENDVVVRWQYVSGWDWWWQVDNVTVTACAAVATPNTDVSPLSLSATQAENTTTTQTLTMANTGAAALNWSLDEEGTPASCTAPSAVPWLSFAPSSGVTAAGGSTPVTVTFDSTGQAAGTYTANLCATSNDPDGGPGNGTALVVVPVTLTVQATPSTPIPAFGTYGKSLMVLLLGGLGLVLLRRRAV